MGLQFPFIKKEKRKKKHGFDKLKPDEGPQVLHIQLYWRICDEDCCACSLANKSILSTIAHIVMINTHS